MDINSIMLKYTTDRYHHISLRYMMGILITIIIGGCCYNPKVELSSLDDYKARYEWIDPEDMFYRMDERNMSFDEVVEKHGPPVYEFDDTVINGLNIKTSLPDYDLYPITMERDTVIVRRCWWFRSYKWNAYLYLVYERQGESPLPIYGYFK